MRCVLADTACGVRRMIFHVEAPRRCLELLRHVTTCVHRARPHTATHSGHRQRRQAQATHLASQTLSKSQLPRKRGALCIPAPNASSTRSCAPLSCTPAALSVGRPSQGASGSWPPQPPPTGGALVEKETQTNVPNRHTHPAAAAATGRTHNARALRKPRSGRPLLTCVQNTHAVAASCPHPPHLAGEGR